MSSATVTVKDSAPNPSESLRPGSMIRCQIDCFGPGQHFDRNRRQTEGSRRREPGVSQINRGVR
jgi:hypothetical protein